MIEEVYNQLSDLSREFYLSFTCSMPGVIYEYYFLGCLEIRIPAVNDNFGDIRIWIDNEEIIIGLGDNFHMHFETYSCGGNISDSAIRKKVINDAIEFIRMVISDRILLRLKFKHDRLVSSHIVHLDKLKGKYILIPLRGFLKRLIPGKTLVSEHTWSGLYKNE
jgi:hypothetical protein